MTTDISHSATPAAARLLRPHSPLELLHPRGYAAHPIVIGSGCPAALLPEQRQGGPMADLVVLAPTAAECALPGWLASAVADAARQLAADGCVYTIVPQRYRGRTHRLLFSAGLRRTLTLAHVPDVANGRFLVALTPRSVWYALCSLIPTRPWKRVLARRALDVPAACHLLAAALPAVGELFQTPGALTPCQWTGALKPQHRQMIAAIGYGRRGSAVTAMLHSVDADSGDATLLAKVALNGAGETRLRQEARALELLGDSAARAGAHIPRAALAARPAAVLTQSIVAGTPAALVLAADPTQLAEVLQRLGGWLERWAALTVIRRSIDAAWLDRQILDPLRAVAPHLPDDTYASRISSLARSCVGRDLPLTAAHHDLTMWNVLLGAHGALGVVDWESGQQSFFPLTDLLYAAVDAVAATSGYSDRLGALRACMTPGGRSTPLVRQLHSRLAQALDAPPEWQELCFHACWLQHAASELGNSTDGAPGQFSRIVQWLADRHDSPGISVYDSI